MRNFVPVVRLVVAALGAVAFGLVPAAGDAAGEPFDIPAIVSLTGPLALIGQAQRDALVALEDFVNKTGGIDGRPIHFAIADDQTNPQIAVQLMNQIAAKNPALVLGPSSSGSCKAVFPLVKQGPVVYCFSIAVDTRPGSFEFGSLATNYDLNLTAIRWLRMRGLTRLALIAPTDTTGQDYDRSIDQILALPENKSLTLVAHEHMNVADVSVAAQIARIKASGANVLLLGTASTAVGTIFRGISDAGLDLPVVGGTGLASQTFMRQYAAVLPKELFVEGFPCLVPSIIVDRSLRSAYQSYRTAMVEHGVGVVDCQAAAAWDPGLILISALRKLGTNANAEQVRAYVAGQVAFAGADGAFDFKRVPQRGIDARSIIITRWDSAKLAFVAASKAGGMPL